MAGIHCRWTVVKPIRWTDARRFLSRAVSNSIRLMDVSNLIHRKAANSYHPRLLLRARNFLHRHRLHGRRHRHRDRPRGLRHRVW